MRTWLHALVSVQLPTEIIRLCTLSQNIEFEGNQYIGSRVFNVAPVVTSNLRQVEDIDISVVNLRPEDRSLFRQAGLGSPRVTITIIASEDDGETWIRVGRDVVGKLSSPRIEGGTYSFRVTLRDLIAGAYKVKYWSHEDRVREYGVSDQGMAMMPQFERKEVLGTWPNI